MVLHRQRRIRINFCFFLCLFFSEKKAVLLCFVMWCFINFYFFSSQEGWRLEQSNLSDPSSPIIFKGVVYNEMKGVFVSMNSTMICLLALGNHEAELLFFICRETLSI